MAGSYKCQARCLKEKIKILNHIDLGDKLIDTTKSTGLKQSTLLTWKKMQLGFENSQIQELF